MDTASEHHLEIYRQRYETWRHLDDRRYSLMKFGGAIGAALITISNTNLSEAIFINLILAASFTLICIWLILRKVNLAIAANGIVLKSVGLSIGDDGLPDTSNRSLSVFNFVEFILAISGFVGIIYSFAKLFGDHLIG